VGGIEAWLACERGEVKGWKNMIKDCDQDVRSDDDVYRRFIPYIQKHPFGKVIGNKEVCEKPECKGKGTVKDGFRRNRGGVYQRLRCIGCGDPLVVNV